MNVSRQKRARVAGFTLVEMMVSTGIVSFVVAGSLTLFVGFLRSYNVSTLMRNTSSHASMALERMVIGVGTNAGLREASRASIKFSQANGGWTLSYSTNLFFAYSLGAKRITNNTGTVICANVITSSVSLFTGGYTTNLWTTNACLVSLTVAETAGGRVWTNTMATQIQFRN
jgi:type II secretory pathway pseudopilin PulG